MEKGTRKKTKYELLRNELFTFRNETLASLS